MNLPSAGQRNVEPAAQVEMATELALERYKYILQQIHTTNENVYRFVAIYQTLATTIAGVGLALFVGYANWGIAPGTARSGLLALMWLETLVAAFSMLLIVVGIISWFDYRKEECELTDEFGRPGFRKPPQVRAFVRWYETYILIFIAGSTLFMWIYTVALLIPAIK